MSTIDLDNFHGNCIADLRDKFDEQTRIALAGAIAALELQHPELEVVSASHLRSVATERVLTDIGVTGPLIETMRMKLTKNTPTPTLRRQ